MFSRERERDREMKRERHTERATHSKRKHDCLEFLFKPQCNNFFQKVWLDFTVRCSSFLAETATRISQTVRTMTWRVERTPPITFLFGTYEWASNCDWLDKNRFFPKTILVQPSMFQVNKAKKNLLNGFKSTYSIFSDTYYSDCVFVSAS